ncbi:MAG: glycosyltransferase [Candidatus Aureabacteria bacterium]|nr:glycosyltransferase [Candidatus Auribacterota bacterium]
MNTALVHDWLNGMRGGEKVLEHICSLFPNAPIFTLHSEKNKISEIINAHKTSNSFIQNLPFKKSIYRYYLPLFPKAIEKFKFDDFDLAISTSHCAAKGIKVDNSTCHICYCFTPMRYVWSLADQYFGKNPVKRALLKPFLSYLKKWDFESSKRVNRFITISKTTQKRIKAFYGRESSIIYPPCNIPFSPVNDKEDFYLIISALVPYKKIDLAINVFNELKYPLKIAGSGPDEKRLKKIAGPNISFSGWISEDEKIDLYKKAKAFIFPGVEDFGITPLESISCGTPVIALKEGGALETINEETGIFFDSQSEQSLKEAVLKFHKNPFSIQTKPDYFDKFSPAAFKENIKTTIADTFTAFKKGKLIF